jgi:hypothetical protein
MSRLGNVTDNEREETETFFREHSEGKPMADYFAGQPLREPVDFAGIGGDRDGGGPE